MLPKLWSPEHHGYFACCDSFPLGSSGDYTFCPPHASPPVHPCCLVFRFSSSLLRSLNGPPPSDLAGYRLNTSHSIMLITLFLNITILAFGPLSFPAQNRMSEVVAEVTSSGQFIYSFSSRVFISSSFHPLFVGRYMFPEQSSYRDCALLDLGLHSDHRKIVKSCEAWHFEFSFTC